MQQHGIMVTNIWHVDPHPTLGVGSKGQNFTFSEYGHVAYQIKGNDTCSIMVVNILSEDVSDLGGGVKRSKFNFYRTWSCFISN